MIKQGAILTYQGTWTATNQSAADTLSFVIGRLIADQLTVLGQSNNIGMFTTTGDFQVVLQLRVDNALGYASPDDVISIVRHEVYITTNQFPKLDAIPQYQNPGEAVTDNSAITGTLSQIFGGAWDTLKSIFSWTPAGSGISGGSALPGISLTNLASGTLSQDQKNQLIQQEQAALVQAGMSSSDASAKAQNDVTQLLLANGADPSQDHSSTYLAIGIALVGLFAVAYVVRSFK